MKKTYLKPTIEEELFSGDDLMITTSVDGTNIVEDGGNTGENNITEGDSRRRRDVWADEESFDEDF